MICATCGAPMDVPGRPWTTNCGGDCRVCMVSFGDPDETAKLKEDFLNVIKELEQT